MTHPRAGKFAEASDLIDVAHVVTRYYSVTPDPEDVAQRVTFGTSGHRGSSLDGAFNEAHILATTQAIVEYRREQGVDGPLFLGRDTHALSEPAWTSALEVLAANDVTVLVDSTDRYTPTPAISHAILRANRDGAGRVRSSGSGLADGIVVTPSHNPPGDGGFKYNPPSGGPADTDATSWIADRANELLAAGLDGVRRIPFPRARRAAQSYDFLSTYVDDLPSALDLDVIRSSGIRIGADPMGGASVDYWGAIAERHGIDLTVVNPLVDPTWRFMTLDGDGKIRMDCSSPNAMHSLIDRRTEFQISTGNDADADRHGIVTPDWGLLNPNHFLAVAIQYLFSSREGWPADAAVGKTLVSSSLIDRVVSSLGRRLLEVPVGFKWFVPGLLDSSVGFGGEESAGASFLRKDGTVWTTDKDGILLALLASEILARTERTPSELYKELTDRFGDPLYVRSDAPASREQKAALSKLSADQVTATSLAGEAIVAKLTEAPGNGAKLGGLKVVTENAWFAARPSGTEDVYKIYAESFKGGQHLRQVQEEAQALVDGVLSGGGSGGSSTTIPLGSGSAPAPAPAGEPAQEPGQDAPATADQDAPVAGAEEEDSSMPYGLLGSMRTKPGARAEVVAILLEGVGELSAVGCRSYVVGLSTTDEDAIWISEVWENKQAHEDSLQLPSVRDAISRAMPLLTGEFSSEEVSVVGGIGI